MPSSSESEELDPGLEGYSDSGSDFHDLPAPALCEGVRKTILRHCAPGEILKRPQHGDEVAVRCCEGVHLQDGSGGEVLRFDLGTGNAARLLGGTGGFLDAAVPTMRRGEVARFTVSVDQGPDLRVEVELLDWVPRKDLFEDGQVVKSTLRRPDDQRRPIVGQRCLLRYRCLLPAAGDKLLVEVPDFDYVIEALPKLPEGGVSNMELFNAAVLSMRRGEIATFACSAEVAFRGAAEAPASGAAVAGSAVAGTEAVRLELELHEFLESTDISFEKDKTVMKLSTRCRDSWTQCQDAGRCSLRVDAVRGAGGEDLVEACDAQSGEAPAVRVLQFTVGNGEVCDALECAAVTMRLGERATISCTQPEACEEPQLGLSGSRPTTVFEVEMIGYEPGPFEEAKRDYQKIELAEARKDQAARLFKEGRHRLAAYRYYKAWELLGLVGYREEFVRKGCEERAATAGHLRRLCMLSRALCLLKVSKFRRAVKACNFVLDEEPGNAKALYRRARARLGLGDSQGALLDAQAALEAAPGDAAARSLLVEARTSARASDAAAKPTFARMCDALGGLPHPLDVD